MELRGPTRGSLLDEPSKVMGMPAELPRLTSTDLGLAPKMHFGRGPIKFCWSTSIRSKTLYHTSPFMQAMIFTVKHGF